MGQYFINGIEVKENKFYDKLKEECLQSVLLEFDEKENNTIKHDFIKFYERVLKILIEDKYEVLINAIYFKIKMN